MLYFVIIILFFAILWTSILPFLLPAFIATVAYMWYLWYNHETILWLVISYSLINAIILLFGNLYINELLTKFSWSKTDETLLEEKNDKWYHFFARLWRSIQQKIDSVSNAYVVFACTVLCCWFVLPDLITIRLVYKKLSWVAFVSAFVLWKILFYTPIIYWISVGVKMM